jgi:Flp pilus assembly pilin Flp
LRACCRQTQSTVEYALLLATLALLVLVGGYVFGNAIQRWLDAVLDHVTYVP